MDTQDVDYFESTQEKRTFAPLIADDYVVKIAKIKFGKVLGFTNGKPDFNKPQELSYTVTVLVAGLKGGGEMTDKNSNPVPPLTMFIDKRVNPYSKGFTPNGDASNLRALICLMENLPTDVERLKTKNFLLVDGQGQIVSDATLRKNALADARLPEEERKMIVQGGYKIFHDIRDYVGKYISVKLTVAKSGKNNNIDSFSRLPANFVLPSPEVEQKALEKFEINFKKREEAFNKHRQSQSTGGVDNDSFSDEQLEVEDVPF